MMLKILRDATILNAYGLNPKFPYEQVWSIGTPEGVSGETVLLGQVCIVPRIAGVADLLGNMDSQGRLVVGLTRARALLDRLCRLTSMQIGAKGTQGPKPGYQGNTWRTRGHGSPPHQEAEPR